MKNNIHFKGLYMYQDNPPKKILNVVLIWAVFVLIGAAIVTVKTIWF